MTVKVKEWVGKEFFWKTICRCFDNEGLGFIERLLQGSNIEYKVIHD